MPFSRDLPDPGIKPGLLHHRSIVYLLSLKKAPASHYQCLIKFTICLQLHGDILIAIRGDSDSDSSTKLWV